MHNNTPMNIKGRTDISIKRFVILEFLFIMKPNEPVEKPLQYD